MTTAHGRAHVIARLTAAARSGKAALERKWNDIGDSYRADAEVMTHKYNLERTQK